MIYILWLKISSVLKILSHHLQRIINTQSKIGDPTQESQTRTDKYIQVNIKQWSEAAGPALAMGC